MSTFLIVARIVLFLASEVPTLIIWIKNERPSVPFSELNTISKVVVGLRYAETALSWFRKALSRYDNASSDNGFFAELYKEPTAYYPESMKSYGDVFRATMSLIDELFSSKDGKDTPTNTLHNMKPVVDAQEDRPINIEPTPGDALTDWSKLEDAMRTANQSADPGLS